jgi:hypothetical protein
MLQQVIQLLLFHFRFRLGCHSLLVPALPLSLFPAAPALATFRLAQRHAALLTVGHEKTSFAHLTQHPLALYLLAKAFEQTLL